MDLGMKRKAGRPKKVVEPSIAEEAGQAHEKRVRLAKEDADRRKNRGKETPVDLWYEMRNGKLVRKSKSKNGNVSSKFVGMEGKIPEAFLKNIKKEGLLK